MRLADLQTPCALVDLDVVERNTAAMSERIRKLGARLRPHVKTHKCVEAARLQVRGHFGGIAVSTLAEAKVFARGGFRDITYAVPLGVARIAEAAALDREVDRLNVLIDHEATLVEMEKHAAAQSTRFSTFLKLDCGYHRAGVNPADPSSVALAARIARSPHVDFRGILTHAGHSYHCHSTDEIRKVARDEREVTLAFVGKLRAAGVPVAEISIGSTPTMSVAESLDGITEARPGNYAFNDRFQATIGSCRLEDAAYSVLTSVIGQYPRRNKILIDAGALALSKDLGARHVDPDCGHGVFYDLDGRRLPLRLYSLTREHGQAEGDAPIGAKLRITPNHACLSAALFDRYHVVRNGEVVDEWRPARLW
jgi:D-serine deaminase-like pyridoxal phosphate-dependent protein